MMKFLQWLIVALFLSFSMVSFTAFADDGATATVAVDDANDDFVYDGEAAMTREGAADGDYIAGSDGDANDANDANDEPVNNARIDNSSANKMAISGSHGKIDRIKRRILAFNDGYSPPPLL